MQNRNFFLFIILFLLSAGLLAGCAPEPVNVLNTDTPVVTNTPEPEGVLETSPTPEETPTAPPVKINKATPDIFITATAKASSMQEDMQKLAAFKVVSSSSGKYYRVQDFTGEWAKLSYYHWWPLNRKPTNFAIRADITWDAALPNANPSIAGCGFVFHENGPGDLHISYLSMDGYVRNYRVEKNVFTDLKSNWAGKFKYPSDSAKFMVVVDYQWLTVFVNDKQVLRFQDDRLNGGGLAFAVASGSNSDFGTRCTFENVELWEFN